MQKIAMVTGGTKRLGLYVTKALLGHGYQVMATYHTGEGVDAANRIHNACEDLPPGLNPVFDVQHLDLTEVLSCQEAVYATESTFGHIDVLVNCAASFKHDWFCNLNAKAWDECMTVNMRGVFILSSMVAIRMGDFTAAKRIAERSWTGSIVNIADVSGLSPRPGYLLNSVAKAGLIAMTKAMATELNPNVRVNCIVPGHILPPSNMMQFRKDHLAKGNLMERWGDPSELAELIITLAENTFVTGAVWNYTGGEELIASDW